MFILLILYFDLLSCEYSYLHFKDKETEALKDYRIPYGIRLESQLRISSTCLHTPILSADTFSR